MRDTEFQLGCQGGLKRLTDSRTEGKPSSKQRE